MRNYKESDHLRENALICEQILSTNSLREYMEISLENLLKVLKTRLNAKSFLRNEFYLDEN